MPLITVSIIQLPPREDAQYGFDVPNHYRKTKAKMSQNLFSNAALTSFFFKHIYRFYVCVMFVMSVFLFFAKYYIMDVRNKKAPQWLVLCVRLFAHSGSFAHVPAHAFQSNVSKWKASHHAIPYQMHLITWRHPSCISLVIDNSWLIQESLI